MNDPIRSREIADRIARILPLVVDRMGRVAGGLEEASGLTRVQVQLLDCLSRQGSCSISTLTRALRRAQSSVSELTDRLEGKGLVQRTAAADRRKSVVALTGKGKQWVARHDLARRTAIFASLEQLDETARESLLGCLLQLARLAEPMLPHPLAPAAPQPHTRPAVTALSA